MLSLTLKRPIPSIRSLLYSCSLRLNSTSSNTDTRFKYFSFPTSLSPTSPAFYTGNAPYHDFLNNIRQRMNPTLLQKVEVVHQNKELIQEQASRFISLESFKSKFGIDMTPIEYKTLISHFLALDPHPFLDSFYSTKIQLERNKKLKALDPLGRAVARGRRKTSYAHVYVVQGTGEFFVNGIPLSDYFTRKPRMAAVYPLELGNVFGKYNVWAIVEGGGDTGQSEAIAHGLAKALVIHEPTLEPKFNALGLLDMDLRLVERKKYGQKKARKKFTWVKR